MIHRNLLWEPNHSLGGVSLGRDIAIYIEEYGLSKDESNIDDGTNWDTYNSTYLDLEIHSDAGKIVSITTETELIYQGENLIGLTVEQVTSLLGRTADEIGESVEYEDGEIQTPYDFFDLGLQLWAESCNVVSASCLNYTEIIEDSHD